MATYYKYAERNASSEINWAEVGSDLTSMLKEENRIREEKKAKLDEESRKIREELSKSPMGESETLRAWGLNFGNDATKSMLMLDRLLKSGELNLKDYLVNRQNLTDGAKSAFDYIQEYQDVYKQKMDRALAGSSQQWEQEVMKLNAEMLDFANSALYINPTNFQVAVGKKNADGSLSNNPNDYHSINDLRNYTKQNYDYFDSDKATTQFVDGIGEFQQLVAQNGGISIVSDASKRTKLDANTNNAINIFNESMQKRFESFGAGNPFNFTSILTNDIGGYGFTQDATVAANDPMMILMKKTANGPLMPDFTTANGKKQKEVIFNYLKVQTLNKIDRKITYQQKQRQITSAEVEAGLKKKEQENAVNSWMILATSSDKAKRTAAINTIKGMKYNQERGLSNIRFDDASNTIYIEYDNPKMNTTLTYDPQKTTLQDWANMGNEVTGLDNVRETLVRSGGGDPKALITNPAGLRGLKATRGSTAPAKTTDLFQTIGSKISSSFKANAATVTADALNAQFANTGIIFTPDEDDVLFKDNIQVMGPNGEDLGTFQMDDSSQLNKLTGIIYNAVKNDSAISTMIIGEEKKPEEEGTEEEGGIMSKY